MDKKFEANKEFMGNVSLQCIKCMANKNKQTSKQKPSRFRSGFYKGSIRKVLNIFCFIDRFNSRFADIALTRRRADEKQKEKKKKRMNKKKKKKKRNTCLKNGGPEQL